MLLLTNSTVVKVTVSMQGNDALSEEDLAGLQFYLQSDSLTLLNDNPYGIQAGKDWPGAVSYNAQSGLILVDHNQAVSLDGAEK